MISCLLRLIIKHVYKRFSPRVYIVIMLTRDPYVNIWSLPVTEPRSRELSDYIERQITDTKVSFSILPRSLEYSLSHPVPKKGHFHREILQRDNMGPCLKKSAVLIEKMKDVKLLQKDRKIPKTSQSWGKCRKPFCGSK